MTKFYVKWQLNPLSTPSDPEERAKLWVSMLEMVKADMLAGRIKDWGNCADGSGGYAIREEASEAEFFTSILKWMPYVTFDAKPVITVDQTIESIKRAAAVVKRK